MLRKSSALAFSVVFGTFGATDEAKTTLLRPLPTECNVLLDLAVEIAHVLSRLSQPVFVKTFGAVGVVSQVRVPEATERMVPDLCVQVCGLTYFSFSSAGCGWRRMMFVGDRGFLSVCTKKAGFRSPMNSLRRVAILGVDRPDISERNGGYRSARRLASLLEKD